jgi:hypothetical protein
MVSAGHSAIRKQQLPLAIKLNDTSHMPSGGHRVTLVVRCSVRTRVLRRNSEYHHGECWSLSNQETAKLAHQ